MNFEKIAIMLAWILFTCFVAFMGTFYIQREMAKGAQLANKYADMLKDEGFTDIPHGDLDRNFTKKHYPMNWLGSEHAFVGALMHQRVDVFNACKHIKTKHLHYAQQPDTAHKHVLYSKYGIYDTHHAEMWNKQLIFEGVANAQHYRLPLGI